MGEQLVSVIVPVYNVKPYVEECLRSILTQTYNQLEVIVVNDGSTDGSGELCDVLAETDDRIRVFHQQNAGLSATRNFALSQAQGDYVTFVDADDGIHETFLEDLIGQLETHEADVAVSNYYKYSHFDGQFYFHNLHQDDLVEVLTPQEALDYQCDIKDYIGMAFITVWGKVFRRSLFDQIAFPVGLLNEDEVVTHKLFLTAQKIVLVNKNSYLYRVRPGSIMTADEVMLRRLVSTVRAFEIKLTDMALAGLSTDLMSRRFAYLLWDIKTKLEEDVATQREAEFYDLVCQRLDWFNRYRQ